MVAVCYHLLYHSKTGLYSVLELLNFHKLSPPPKKKIVKLVCFLFIDFVTYIYMCVCVCVCVCVCGSSVGIATDYGLDGPGSNAGGDEIFRLSRPALGPT